MIFKVILRTYARREIKNYIFSFEEICGSFSEVHRIILNSVYCVSYLRQNKWMHIFTSSILFWTETKEI